MGTKTIRLDEDVYEYLKSKKRDDETFSDAVDRLTDDWSLIDLVETYTHDDAERHRELLRQSNANAATNRDALLERLDSGDE